MDRGELRVTVLATILITSAAVVAVSPNPLADGSEPTADEALASENLASEDDLFGVHLSFTEDPSTTMTVSWMTVGAQDPGSIVEHGPSCDSLDETTPGSSSQLELRVSLRVHEATLTGFEPGETFAYRVGGDLGYSECYTTHTAPEDEPLEFAVYGDQGIGIDAQGVHDEIMKKVDDLDLVLIAGDLSYAESDQEVWNDWLKMTEELFARVPMMSSPGNHEARTPIGTGDYQQHVAQPGEEIYYSFDYSNVHILVVQSHFSQARQEGILEEMTLFMEQDLSEAQQAKEAGEIDHIFVLQHHPLYSNTDDREMERELMLWEEHLFHRYDVNLLLAGHNHGYERSRPMVYTTPTDTTEGPYEDPIGFIQLISGGGGRSIYDFNPESEFSEFYADHKAAFHYTHMTVDRERVDVQAIQAMDHDDGTSFGHVIDSFTLIDTDERYQAPGTPLTTSLAS